MSDGRIISKITDEV